MPALTLMHVIIAGVPNYAAIGLGFWIMYIDVFPMLYGSFGRNRARVTIFSTHLIELQLMFYKVDLTTLFVTFP